MNENSKFELFLYFTSWNFIFRIEFIYILTVRWSNNDRNRIKGIEKESRIDGASVEMAGADSASVIPLFFLCRCSSFFERDKTNRHVTECTEELCIYDCIENASICFSNSPVFVRLTFRRFFIGQTSREHRSWFFWTTRFDYPILYPDFFESTFTREWKFFFSSLVFYFSPRSYFKALFRNVSILYQSDENNGNFWI